MSAKIAIFQQKEIRKQLYNGEWWFVVQIVPPLGLVFDTLGGKVVSPDNYLSEPQQKQLE